MNYSSLRQCIDDLEHNGHLLRIKEEVDPYLEMAAIHRKIYAQKGPAILFENVKGSAFPAVSNIFGSEERWRFIFRKQLDFVKLAIRLKADPAEFFQKAIKDFWCHPLSYLKLLSTGFKTIPAKVSSHSWQKTSIDKLPQITCWSEDGGPFITLPQVFCREPGQDKILRSNLGMYRVQMAGNKYQINKEVGLHYQIHRGLGVMHKKALDMKMDLPVTIFVGGPPAHTVSSVMPMPDGMSEIIFAGMLADRRFKYSLVGEHVLSEEADFCITGWLRGSKTKPEGPFGDHLGYYSLTHDFPVLEVECVYHRHDAIWPFTVVGRPPQEDSSFGALIHELTESMVPAEIPGVKEIHAVDEAGVHPLLLAIGSERYTPYSETRPAEILTQANAILGFNQCSLAKFLFIVDEHDNPQLRCSNIKAFFTHVLERVDWRRDLHFQTNTTIDTLDYSGVGLNQGSKLVVAVCGEKKRSLSEVALNEFYLPEPFTSFSFVMSGVLAISFTKFTNYKEAEVEIKELCKHLATQDLSEVPLLILCDDSKFCAEDLSNFLWLTFTRTNPSHDIYGVNSYVRFKHWGCEGSLVIDARIKPHHAPPLVEDKRTTDKIRRFNFI